MSDEREQSALARWGSAPMSRRDKVLMTLGFVVVAAVAIAIFAWAGSGINDDRSKLENKLNAHYKEPISIGVQTVGNHTSFTFDVDGARRPDCNATDDGYLDCSDDPQPTLEDAPKN